MAAHAVHDGLLKWQCLPSALVVTGFFGQVKIFIGPFNSACREWSKPATRLCLTDYFTERYFLDIRRGSPGFFHWSSPLRSLL